MIRCRIHIKVTVVWLVWFWYLCWVQRRKQRLLEAELVAFRNLLLEGLSCSQVYALSLVWILFSRSWCTIVGRVRAWRCICGYLNEILYIWVNVIWWDMMQVGFWISGLGYVSLVASCSSFPYRQKMHAGKVLLKLGRKQLILKLELCLVMFVYAVCGP